MNKSFTSKFKTTLLILLVINFIFSLLIIKIHAQQQDFNFSGNSADSYQCFRADGTLIANADGTPKTPLGPDAQGEFHCIDEGHIIKAYLRPPKLQEIELLFVKVLYSIWALAASLSFLFLVILGYQYLLRGGTSDEELVKLRKRIINFIAGFLLVFLAVPILSTVFRLLGIDNSVKCYNVSMPAFQFFYANLCTDPNNVVANQIIKDPCNVKDGNGKFLNAVGLTCSKENIGRSSICPIVSGISLEYICKDKNGENGTWCQILNVGSAKITNCNSSN